MNKLILFIFAIFLSGCAAVNPVLKEPYTVKHVDGRTMRVIHAANDIDTIMINCGVYYERGKPSNVYQPSGYTHSYTTPNACVKIIGDTCYISAETPVNEVTQGYWDHEEKHCKGETIPFHNEPKGTRVF